MKPGNLQSKVPNPAATRDEDSIERTSSLRCVRFYFLCERERILYYGKKTVYFRVCYLRPPR